MEVLSRLAQMARRWAVGAPGEDSNAVGVNGEAENDLAPDTGAVYVFRFDNLQWTQEAYVKPSVPTGDATRSGVPSEYAARYGPSVALNANGNRLAIGMPYEDNCAGGINDFTYSEYLDCEDTGAVYLLAFDGQDWSQHTYFGGHWNDFWSLGTRFGFSVDLSADGNRLAASAPKYERRYPGQFGAVFVYTDEGNNWTSQLVGPPESDDDFTSAGDAIGLSADGNRLAINVSWENIPEPSEPASNGGAALTYDFVDSTWQAMPWIRGRNGVSTLALSGDGQMLAIGATVESSMAVGVNGDENDNAAERAGAVYMYTIENGNWAQSSYIKALNTNPNDRFGRGIALNHDGSVLSVGATGEDSQAVGVNGDDTDNSATDSGGVFIY